MKTLTLSGWTQPADALSHLVPDALTFDYSDYPNAQASFVGLQAFANVERIVAWSLGGQLALRAIAAGVLNPKRLIILAAPYRFVGEKGMDDFTYQQFHENYVTDTARSKTRLHGLIAKGDVRHKEIVGLLSHHLEVENTQRWLPWLDDLGRFDMGSLEMPASLSPLIIHGVNDAIVPVEQSEILVKRFHSGILEKWDACGHAPHLHDTERLKARINQCQ